MTKKAAKKKTAKKQPKSSRPASRSIGTVSFSIAGDFITDKAREFWEERSFARAIEVLECCMGISQDQIFEILKGKKKLVGVDDLSLVDDDWTPPEHYASRADALKWGEAGEPAPVPEYPKFVWEEERKTWAWVDEDQTVLFRTFDQADEPRNWDDSLMLQDYTPEALVNAATGLLTDAGEEALAQPMGLIPDFDSIAHSTDWEKELDMKNRMMMEIQNYPMDRGANLPTTPSDDVEAQSAWICPAGKFYGCANMEHIGLAENLASELFPEAEGVDGESLLEAKGWVKVAQTMLGFHVMCLGTVTKRQQTKLWDYCERHKKDYQKHVEVLDLA